MRLSLSIDTRHALRLTRSVLRQIDFAMSQALNDTAKDAQAAQRSKLRERFTIRGSVAQRFLERMVKIPSGGFARRGKLYVDLLIQGPKSDLKRGAVLARHEEGGRFGPGRSPAFFIPGRVLRRGSSPIPRRLYPKKLGIVPGDPARRIGKARTFGVGPLFGTAGTRSMILQRKGKGRVEVLWLYEEQPITIEERLKFQDTVRRTARERFPDHFRQRFLDALRTAK